MIFLGNSVWAYSAMNKQEIELIEAFRRMPAEARETMFRVAKMYAAEDAAQKRPLLQLVRTTQDSQFRARQLFRHSGG